MQTLPGVAWIALLTGLIAWLQSYFGSWEYTATITVVIGMVINLIKIYFPAEPTAPMGTARGLESGEPRSRLARFFF